MPHPKRLIPFALELPRLAKRFIALSIDVSLCVFSLWLAYFLRLGEFVSLHGNGLWASAASVFIAVPIFIASGFYRTIFRYVGLPTIMAIVRAVAVYGLIYAAIFTAIGVPGVPRTIGIIQPILVLLLVCASRVSARFLFGADDRQRLRYASRTKALVYGAGDAGMQLAEAMANSPEMQIVGFLDDDTRLHGQVLNGLLIYNPTELGDIAISLEINTVLLAIPSLTRKRRNEILGLIQAAHVSVRTLPNLNDLAKGIVSVSDVRDLDVEDLLGRDPVTPNPLLMAKNITGKVVLVTGAGGSIGSELCRQINSMSPKRLVLLEQSEFALYSIFTELQNRIAGSETFDSTDSERLIPLLGTVQDKDRMLSIMSDWSPHTVYHAAAYKHVPLVEINPIEGIKNNVLGTLRAVEAAIECGVSDFVLVSSDKAVRPTNVMGASKRVAELILQAMSAESVKTRLSIVRFGNVLGSSGSVVPLFRQQIRHGGPVTLTHPEVTRYFMTIPEAAQLVIQAGALAEGGDVFVLDMGQPVKIASLARRMIELSGFSVKDQDNPNGDIPIALIGLRSGEKLYEELLIGSDSKPTTHPRIKVANEEFMPWVQLGLELSALASATAKNDSETINQVLHRMVSGY